MFCNVGLSSPILSNVHWRGVQWFSPMRQLSRKHIGPLQEKLTEGYLSESGYLRCRTRQELIDMVCRGYPSCAPRLSHWRPTGCHEGRMPVFKIGYDRKFASSQVTEIFFPFWSLNAKVNAKGQPDASWLWRWPSFWSFTNSSFLVQ